MMQSSKTLDLTETGTGHTGCGTFNALDAAALDYATEFLDDTSLLHFTQTSLSLRIRLLNDDTWLNKLTMCSSTCTLESHTLSRVRTRRLLAGIGGFDERSPAPRQ